MFDGDSDGVATNQSSGFVQPDPVAPDSVAGRAVVSDCDSGSIGMPADDVARGRRGAADEIVGAAPDSKNVDPAAIDTRSLPADGGLPVRTHTDVVSCDGVVASINEHVCVAAADQYVSLNCITHAVGVGTESGSTARDADVAAAEANEARLVSVE